MMHARMHKCIEQFFGEMLGEIMVFKRPSASDMKKPYLPTRRHYEALHQKDLV
ncbi:Uncharacterised protein [Serratia fonticola]|uniref:Uncharacterized protein n=1 Tax=Serratia fonticola TaxID=47917 RepID=A0A4U9VP64_SERFO|nr:Uncharacterised protein [Serratia fonticola]VTR45241.1 Uncharacterised protein [Serratia fonticola]